MNTTFDSNNATYRYICPCKEVSKQCLLDQWIFLASLTPDKKFWSLIEAALLAAVSLQLGQTKVWFPTDKGDNIESVHQLPLEPLSILVLVLASQLPQFLLHSCLCSVLTRRWHWGEKKKDTERAEADKHGIILTRPHSMPRKKQAGGVEREVTMRSNYQRSRARRTAQKGQKWDCRVLRR